MAKEKIIANEKISFITKRPEALLNSVRRSSFEIPILAIDEVEFYKNDSVLYDEVLALRLGLIPLKTPNDLKLKEKCSCKGEGCNKCTIKLKLKAVGPTTVYSSALKGGTEPTYNNIPIIELRKDQELELVAEARLGKAVEHTKYSPGLVYYRALALCKNCKKNHDVLKNEDGKEETLDIHKCDVCSQETPEETFAGKEFLFVIEPWGQIKAEDILQKAIKAIKENLDDLK